MRIAQIATNVERVPPHGYGGTELIVSSLTEELLKRGHEVTLFATADSQTDAKLISVVEKPLRTDSHYTRAQWQAFDIRLLLKLEELQNQFDIVHNHLGWQALPTMSRLRCPTVTTNHNPIKTYSADIYLAQRNLPYVAISHAYKRLNLGDVLNYVDVVHNGIDCSLFDNDVGNNDRKFLLFLGRLGKAKGTKDAMEVAHRLRLPLKLGGKIDETDRQYFEEEVKPRLEWEGMEFVGEVSFEEKLELYRQAIAVVYPVAFDEPFGLVMAEALASGTPVMAFDRGAVREILDDGETAIVGATVDDLVRRFPEIQTINRATCRQRARERFDIQRMVDGYESAYARVLASAGALVAT